MVTQRPENVKENKKIRVKSENDVRRNRVTLSRFRIKQTMDNSNATDCSND